ncbi:hypothetical protein [Thioclava kandeliae]|uniref:Uncharacterized protein n=1 Tax=Thioclava kandeliae TaxID=3070818 RepID=A0ABV1SIB3_9RHOB
MTPTQKKLARHALGLPNRNHTSYRNCFVTPYGPHSDFTAWEEMKDLGFAERTELQSRINTVRFWLTRKGAMAAIDPNEKLDSEDFPHPH